MQNIKFLLQKEFRQIFRNTAILRLIFAMPIIQLILIPLAADYEIKDLNISVVDHDHSSYSRQLTEKFRSTEYFKLVDYGERYEDALIQVGNSEVDLILTIPAHFERDLVREDVASLQLAADAVNGVRAGLGTAYAQQIIAGFNQNIRLEALPQLEAQQASIGITSSLWYNPHISYYLFMVPGILGILVTMVGSFLTALNIVAEKEMGTMEQINVSPIKKHEFILGKLIPFWVLGMISIMMGIFIAWLVYGIFPQGSLLVIYAYAALYLLAVLGIGLLLSTFADNQQQATLFAFFVMMIFILMGGLYTPVDSMPEWAQWMSAANPPTYLIRAIRAVYIKGSGFADLSFEFLITAVFAVLFNVLAVLNYRKTGA